MSYCEKLCKKNQLPDETIDYKQCAYPHFPQNSMKVACNLEFRKSEPW